MKLPDPDCRFGYPLSQAQEILAEREPEFWRWMRGQTTTICNGCIYNHERRAYEPSGCGPHGRVVDQVDLERFLAGGQPLD